MATAEIKNWWTSDLPTDQPEVFGAYLAAHPQYQQTESENPIPFPQEIENEQVRWYNEAEEKPVVYNSFKQGLVTGLKRGWLPEEPVVAEAEQPKVGNRCSACDKWFATSTGLKIHTKLSHK